MSTSQNFIVPARSWDDIGRIACSLREQFGLASVASFAINDFIEKVLDHQFGLIRFEVDDRAGMGGAEGLTCPKGEFIALREDVYKKGLEGDGRARFTAAHELGHFVLHTNMPLPRAPLGKVVPVYRLSEPQANQFAAELLMPARFLSQIDSPQSVAARHGTSIESATNRLSYLRSKGRLA